MSTFNDLLSRHIASSLLKQQSLSRFLGEHNWSVSLSDGVVDFGKGRVYPIQIIGTESELNGTWLWAWANTESPIPAPLLRCAGQLRSLGENEGIEELTQAELELDRVDGHMLAMVACGVCNADAYYRGPYEGGAAFFLMHQTPLQEPPPSSSTEMINLMASVISQFPVNHRLMAQAFLQQQGYKLVESEDRIVASSAAGSEITITFEAAGRISGMETTATPGPATSATASKKPRWRFGR